MINYIYAIAVLHFFECLRLVFLLYGHRSDLPPFPGAVVLVCGGYNIACCIQNTIRSDRRLRWARGYILSFGNLLQKSQVVGGRARNCIDEPSG